MTRIGVDVTSALRQGAGIGRYTRELMRAVTRLDRDTDYVPFSASGGLPREQRDALKREGWPLNVSWRHLPLTDRQMAVLWQRLHVPVPVEWITGPIDLFHSPDFTLPPVGRAVTALTVHDLSFMRHPGSFTPALLAYLMRTVPRSVRRADLVLADSLSTQRDLVELLRVPQERTAVVYPGVDRRFTPQAKPGDAAALARYHIERPYVLGLGTLQPRKNFGRLITAFGMLIQQYDLPHQLVIGGGRGWLDEEIGEAISTLREPERVQLIGFVRDQDLPALYRGADAFAFPSLYEGFGIPVLEAMGCGTPTVTSNTSSLPEAAGDAALLVPPKDVEALCDALWRVLSDEALRKELRTRGWRHVTHFSWERAAKALFGLYRSVIGKGG